MIARFIILSLLTVVPLSAQKDAVGMEMYDLSKLEWIVPSRYSEVDIDGKVVVLQFWGTWCAPCIKHLPELNRQVAELDTTQVRVISISMYDTRGKVDSFLQHNELNTLAATDPDNLIGRYYYGVHVAPYTILLDRSGVAVWEGLPQGLSTRMIIDFANTGIPPKDESEEDRTLYQLSVKRALPSDKAREDLRDEGARRRVELRGCSGHRVVSSIAEALGHANLTVDHKGIWDSLAYNVDLTIDTTLITDDMRERLLGQLDVLLNVHTEIKGVEHDGLLLSIADSNTFESVRYKKLGSYNPIPDDVVILNDEYRGDKVRVQVVAEFLSMFFGRRVRCVDQALCESYIHLRMPITTEAEALDYLRQNGLSEVPSTWTSPHATVTYLGSMRKVADQ